MPAETLCVLLLPSALEEFTRADEVRDLLRAPAVVAVEPARVSHEMLAAIQSRRLVRKLPGAPRVVVLFDPAQYPLARAVVARVGDCELWYGGEAGRGDESTEMLHELARQRAALTFGRSDEPSAFQRNAPLWDRLEELRIARR